MTGVWNRLWHCHLVATSSSGILFYAVSALSTLVACQIVSSKECAEPSSNVTYQLLGSPVQSISQDRKDIVPFDRNETCKAHFSAFRKTRKLWTNFPRAHCPCHSMAPSPGRTNETPINLLVNTAISLVLKKPRQKWQMLHPGGVRTFRLSAASLFGIPLQSPST